MNTPDPNATPRRDPSDDSLGEAALFRRLIEGQLSPSEFAEVEARLLDDPAFRERYVETIRLEADLPAALERTAPAPLVQTSSSRRRAFAWTIIAASIAVVLGGGLWLAQLSPLDPLQTRISLSSYAETGLRGQREVCVVTRAEGIDDRSSQDVFRTGARLKPGVLSLRSGELQLDFLNGARLVLQGPAELHVLSESAATLVSGKAAARVPEAARGFILNAPDAAVVDLGTEFALDVNAFGQSDVYVLDGEVEVSLLGDDGNTLTSKRLLQSESLRVSRANAIEELHRPTPNLPRVTELPTPALPVPDDYIATIKASGPVVYWRFETVSDGESPNEIGLAFPARLVVSDKEPEALRIENGSVHFSASKQPRGVQTGDPIPGLNVEEFSYEMWINPRELHYATLLGCYPQGEVWENQYYLNVIELAYRTSLVHGSGVFRFLHRHPPNAGGGVNLFSHEGSTPGQWHHLVAVKTPTEGRLYVNGRLARQLELKGGTDHLPYHVILGGLRMSNTERQFRGAMDEFAIYDRALTDEEVAGHYDSMWSLDQ